MVTLNRISGTQSSPALNDPFLLVDLQRMAPREQRRRGLAHQIVNGCYLGVAMWLASILLLMVLGSVW